MFVPVRYACGHTVATEVPNYRKDREEFLYNAGNFELCPKCKKLGLTYDEEEKLKAKNRVDPSIKGGKWEIREKKYSEQRKAQRKQIDYEKSHSYFVGAVNHKERPNCIEQEEDGRKWIDYEGQLKKNINILSMKTVAEYLLALSIVCFLFLRLRNAVSDMAII